MPTTWSGCLQLLGREIPDYDYNAWIRPLHVRESGDDLELLAPNPFIEEYVRENYLDTIALTLKQMGNSSLQLSLGTRNDSTILAVDTRRELEKPTLTNHLNPFFTFEQFVDSDSSRLAYLAARQVANQPGGDYNPLFIYGGTGLGKTHLMHAIGHALLKKNPKSRVLYVRSERFVTHFIAALRHKTIDQFKQLYQSVDILLIDDIQFFAKKSSSQDEFLNLYNLLLDHHKQVVLTSDRYSKEITDLDHRLKSRFGSGMSFPVKPPAKEVRVEILLRKAQQLALDLPGDIAELIAKTVKSNVRELEGALNNVLARTQLTGEAITLESTKGALSSLIAVQNRLLSIGNIQQAVCEHYGVSLSLLLSSKRSRSITKPRQIAMSLARELTDRSLPEIGKAFGGRNHATVLYACRKVEALRAEEPDVAHHYQTLLETLS